MKQPSMVGQIDLFRPRGLTVQDILKVFRGARVIYQGPKLSPAEIDTYQGLKS